MSKKQSGRKMGLALCLGVLLAVFAAFPIHAAGEGYSDLYKMYSMSGVDKNLNIDAVALAYGSESAGPADNYAVVMKMNSKKDDLLLDVVSGDRLEAILQNCVTITQTSVDAINELLLVNGAPDEWLLLGSQPGYVSKIKQAAEGGQSNVVLEDEILLPPDTLKMAAAKGGASFRIHSDSKIGNSVNVRMTVNPSAATKGIVTLAYTHDDSMRGMVSKYEQRYNNKFAAIQFYQEGSFGTTVQVAAKVNLNGLNKNNLYFYSFNRVTNTYTLVENTNYSIDDKGYLNFSTGYGNTMLITDRPLQQK